jgi:hypothetical protein
MMSTERITLREGPTVDVEAIRLAIDLEGRGFMLIQRPEYPAELVIVRGPRCAMDDFLKEPEREAIRRLKPHLLALVVYQAPGMP